MAMLRRAIAARLFASIATFVTFAGPTRAQQLVQAEKLDPVTVTSPRPSSLPLEIPTTVERITRQQIDDSGRTGHDL